MNSFIPWVGGKGKLLWIINKLMPDRYTRFIDVFGGSGTVTMCRPIQRGCMEVYNDFNGNLTNLFCCVKNRPMALLAELGFLPLNTRDDFNVLYKFFSKGEFTDDYLQEEMDLTEVYLKPPDAEAIRALMLERAPRGSIRRAADFFKLIRYSFSGGAKSFGGKPCDIRRFFHLIWECSRRLANVIVENKDFEEVIRQYRSAGIPIETQVRVCPRSSLRAAAKPALLPSEAILPMNRLSVPLLDTQEWTSIRSLAETTSW